MAMLWSALVKRCLNRRRTHPNAILRQFIYLREACACDVKSASHLLFYFFPLSFAFNLCLCSSCAALCFGIAAANCCWRPVHAAICVINANLFVIMLYSFKLQYFQHELWSHNKRVKYDCFVVFISGRASRIRVAPAQAATASANCIPLFLTSLCYLSSRRGKHFEMNERIGEIEEIERNMQK